MSNKEQKYIISEFYKFSADREMILEAEKKNSIITLVGILQKADTLNRNGRVYPYDILKREATKYMEQVENRTAYGELDHPDSAVISLDNTSHMVVDMWWEGKVLYGKVVIFDEHPSGSKLKAILKGGGTLGISSRGVGSVNSENGRDVVQEDFELIGFDFVSSPSTPGAYMFKEGREIGLNGMVKLESEEVSKEVSVENKEAIKEGVSRFKELYNQATDGFWGQL